MQHSTQRHRVHAPVKRGLKRRKARTQSSYAYDPFFGGIESSSTRTQTSTHANDNTNTDTDTQRLAAKTRTRTQTSFARRRAIAMASAEEILMTSSSSEVSQFPGTNPAPIPWTHQSSCKARTVHTKHQNLQGTNPAPIPWTHGVACKARTVHVHHEVKGSPTHDSHICEEGVK